MICRDTFKSIYAIVYLYDLTYTTIKLLHNINIPHTIPFINVYFHLESLHCRSGLLFLSVYGDTNFCYKIVCVTLCSECSSPYSVLDENLPCNMARMIGLLARTKTACDPACPTASDQRHTLQIPIRYTQII